MDDYEPRVSLTDILINNEPLAKFAEWKDKAVPSIDTMRLIYDQNFLSFRFAGLEFTNPEKLQYRYMLTGIDKDWVNAGTQNSANYTNLAPGSYDLKINVTNTVGIWSPHGKTYPYNNKSALVGNLVGLYFLPGCSSDDHPYPVPCSP